MSDFSNALAYIYNELFGVKPANALFLSDKSATADKNMLSEAKRMESRGAPREDIYNKTKWFKDSGVWNYETDDRGEGYLSRRLIDEMNRHTYPDDQRKFASIYSNMLAAYNRPDIQQEPVAPIANAITHNVLAAAFPRNYSKTFFSPQLDPNEGERGHFFSASPDPVLTITKAATSGGSESARQTAVHELQHAADFYSGNRNVYSPRREGGPIPYYDNRMERRAMNVAFRRDWTPEQRMQTPPWVTEPIAVKEHQEQSQSRSDMPPWLQPYFGGRK